ncbi:hypothetical protein CEH78_003311 [Salmonella enterica]|nr:hypothetical protein [Salmonella enterica]
MKTTELKPDNKWVMACSGSKNMLLQLLAGEAAFCISDTAPPDDSPYHYMQQGVLIPVSAPTKVWVRSTRTYKQDTLIIVSETE